MYGGAGAEGWGVGGEEGVMGCGRRIHKNRNSLLVTEFHRGTYILSYSISLAN